MTYIDWSKAPEGTTQVFDDGDNCIGANGLPKLPRYWEKVEDDIIYEWTGTAWYPIGYVDMSNRTPNPHLQKEPQGFDMNSVIPKGFKCIGYRPPEKGELFLESHRAGGFNIANTNYIGKYFILEPVEPPKSQREVDIEDEIRKLQKELKEIRGEKG